jgi:uncharacterized membrane protein YsdA (DUF1294 family)
MGDVVAWILAIVSALLLVGIIGGLIAFVAQLFTSHKRPKPRFKGKKKKG